MEINNGGNVPERPEPASTFRGASDEVLSIGPITVRHRHRWLTILVVVAILVGAALYFFCVKPRQSQGPTIVSGDLNLLKITMEQNIHDIRFDLLPKSLDPIVKGMPGETFIIRPKGDDGKELFLFEPAIYNTPSWRRQFEDSMGRVFSQVVSPIRDKVRYTLFVSGSADHSGYRAPYFKDRQLDKSDPRRIWFLKHNPDDVEQFLPVFGFKDIPERYKNEHLPYLRAWFIHHELQKHLHADSFILEGNVGEKDDTPEDRNAKLLLCVHWDVKPGELMPALENIKAASRDNQ